MIPKKHVPWIIASLPWIGLFCLFVEIVQAVIHFGHIPSYGVDPDPFHNDWYFLLSDTLVFGYLLLPFLLIPWGILLIVPPLRYSGRHRILFIAYVGLTIAAVWVLTLRDMTGFIGWRLD